MVVCTCMCCSSAWPQPGGSQTACRIRHCCKLQATPRSGRFPGGSWSLLDGRDRKKKNIKYESQMKGCKAFWASGEDLKESQLFIILESKSKIILVAGSGGLILAEVSFIFYTQKKEGNKTPHSSQSPSESIKKLRSGPLKAAASCLPFETKALSKTVGLNHLDLPAKQLLIQIFSKKKKKVPRHLWFLSLSSRLTAADRFTL